MRDTVASDVQALQKSSTSAPDKTAVDTLNKDLAALDGATPDFTQGQLKTDLEAVIKSTGASDDTTVTKLEGDLNAVAQAMNVTSDDVATIQADQKAIADDGGPTAPDTTAGVPLYGDLLGGLTGVPGQPQGAGGWGPSATGVNGTRSDTLQKDFEKLQTDLKAIQDKSQVTPAMLAAVRNDVQALQKSSTSAPDKTAVDTLNKDLAALDGATPDFTQGQLKTDLEAVIKSTGASDDTTVTKLEGDLNAVAQAMNVTSDDVATIQADQKAIADDGGPSSPAGTSTDPLTQTLLGSLGFGSQVTPPTGFGNGGPGGLVGGPASKLSGQPGGPQGFMVNAGGQSFGGPQAMMGGPGGRSFGAAGSQSFGLPGRGLSYGPRGMRGGQPGGPQAV